MEDEVEDIVGDVKNTDSQKSVTTSNVYSLDFTDSSSDKNISSGKDTYVIDQDSECDSYQIHSDESIINIKDVTTKQDIEAVSLNKANRSACTSIQRFTFIGEETFTQTSKTIFDLTSNKATNSIESNNLETQTSFASMSENKIVSYTIHVTENKSSVNPKHTFCNINDGIKNIVTPLKEATYNPTIIESSDNNPGIQEIEVKVDENFIRFVDDEQKDNSSEAFNETLDRTSDFDSSNHSDIDEDSLMENEYHTPKIDQDNSSDIIDELMTEKDVDELYNKITENTRDPLTLSDRNVESGITNIGMLIPLTEETNKKESILDITPSVETLCKTNNDHNEEVLPPEHYKMQSLIDNQNTGYKILMKLPTINKNKSCPNSPLVNSLFSVHTPQTLFKKRNALPDVFEKQRACRWDIDSKILASGESPFIQCNNDVNEMPNAVQLPPIVKKCRISELFQTKVNNNVKNKNIEEISIKGRIKELKINNANNYRRKTESRSVSPTSNSSLEFKLCDAAERGCEALCSELLRLLRSQSWVEIVDTLEYLPRALDKFWSVISENRTDLLRQVRALVESPRTQVARTACETLAYVLKNTNYTKKPDFYETFSTLLTKTSSFNRLVRRAANIALDDIVCHVDFVHSVTAICVYGVEHKSPVVRCASSRLLVVCCALAEGGRQLLRPRPPTVAAARRHTLRALALLLHDKNLETRKYAERLYSMLRPLSSFEPYFLTDVDVESATGLIKKYDHLLKIKKT